MFKGNKKEEEGRFHVKSVEDNPKLGRFSVIVDRETGVHYLHSWVGTGSSITPLLDQDGQVVIEKTEN